MKVRTYIMTRYKDLKSKYELVQIKTDNYGYYHYSFKPKVVLIVNALEHQQIQKQKGV